MDFPKLEKNQVALLRTDTYTGRVLDNMFQLYDVNDSNQIVYSIFDSIQEAQTYANKVLGDNNRIGIEITIYDVDRKEVFHNNGLR